MLSMSPYIVFNGEAREALTFYQSVFGGDLHTTTFSEFGGPAGSEQEIMHGQLTTSSFVLMASDNPDKTSPRGPGNVTICLWGDDVDTGRAWFAALAEGAQVNMDFAEQIWGDWYGDVTDRFGVSWGINVTKRA